MPKGRPKSAPYIAISVRFPLPVHEEATEAAANASPRMSFSGFVVEAVKEKLSGVHHHPETTVVVEAADTAPLLQRIAELEKRLETVTQREGDRLGEIEERLTTLNIDSRLDDFEYRLQAQLQARLDVAIASARPKSDPRVEELESELEELREELKETKEANALALYRIDSLEEELESLQPHSENDKALQYLQTRTNTIAAEEKKREGLEADSSEPTSDATPIGDESEEEKTSELDEGVQTLLAPSERFTYGDWIRTSHDCLGWTCHRDPSLAVPRSIQEDERFMVLQAGEDWVKGMHVYFLSDRIVPLSLSPLKLYKKDIEILEGDRDYYKSIFDEDGLFDEDDAEEQFNRVEKQLHGLPPAKGFGRKAS